MLKNLKNRQEGFTIIEVMIVLVIAAVILLIVFLAVPALQRNSRNTQKKNVAADILSAASEFSSNNSGNIPTNGGSNCPANGSCAANAALAGATDATKILALVNTNGIVNALTIRAQGGGGLGANPPSTTVYIETNATCNGNATAPGTSPRQVAILYPVEGPGGAAQAACASSGL